MLAQLLPGNNEPPITLDQPITVVGRSARLCDLPIEHNAVSKIHCILVKTDGLIYMRDLGSTNGTRVNGQRVLRGALLPGDQISFGGAAFTVHLGPDPEKGSAAASPTEMIPLVTDTDAELPTDDVKLLSDSDYLPAD